MYLYVLGLLLLSANTLKFAKILYKQKYFAAAVSFEKLA